MRKIKAQKLTKEAFAPFGTYYDVLKPEGAHLGDFYQDHVIDPVAFGVPMGFSALVAHKAEKMIVKGSEYHNYTGEVMIPLDGDVIIYVAPVSKEPVPQETKAFIVPQGPVVRLETGVWHLGQFPVSKEEVHLLLALPQRTYVNDCCVVDYDEKDYLEITK